MNRLSKLLVVYCFLFTYESALCAQESPAQVAVNSETVDFATQIMPIFSRFGCNAAECHGSATGRGDFKLSLFGGDPQRDYDAIVNELFGRRINLLSPEKSLLISKPTEVLAHGGGEVFEPDSVAVRRITKWIRASTPFESSIKIEGIEVANSQVLIGKRNKNFNIRVFANTNLSKSDVTGDASFASSNPTAVKVSDNGSVTVHKPGKHFVIVKYLQFSKTVTIINPFENGDRKIVASKIHPIDRLVEKSVNSLRLEFPDPASDSKLVRRLYLDLTGKLPTAKQSQSYVRSTHPKKKQRLVDELLKSNAFQNYWTFWLRKVIQFQKPGNDAKASAALNQWLIESIANDRSWSSIAKQLVVATGNTDKIPAANFHRFFIDARGEAETVANAFLGFRIECANCHNHPLDQWTQEDYHGLAAIFAPLKRGKTVELFPNGTVIQPKTGKAAVPKIPGEYNLEPAKDQRNEFADWMVKSERFKMSIANRVWHHFLGRGIVEPIDDFRQSNPPIDEKLLKALAGHFEQNDFKFRSLIRLIVTSDVYASQSSNSLSSDYWTGYRTKRISPEVYYNICRQVLYGEKKPVSDQELATTNFELAGQDNSLRLLKGCDPRGDCTVGESTNNEFGLREKLHLINGKFLNRWIVDRENDYNDSISDLDEINKLLAQFYWRAFSRSMTAEESKYWKSQTSKLANASDSKIRNEFLQDAIWSLINSREFRSIQ